MWQYILRRTGQAMVVIILVTFLTFLLLHNLPGGAARSALGLDATPAQIDAYNEQMGYDKPFLIQYMMYLGRLASGDLGFSFQQNQPVADLIVQRLPKTMLLSFLAAFVALVVSIPLGAIQAVTRGKVPDYFVTAVALFAYATPLFFLGMLLIVLFSQTTSLLPPQAPQGFGLGEILADWPGLILPVATLAIATLAAYTRYVRSSMIDNLQENYIRTAKAKGLSGGRVVVRHALRNSLFPVISLLGMYIPALFSGALVVEQLFNYPGMGLMFWQATQTRDFPILLATTTIVALATVIGSLLADFAYAVADPRVRLSGDS
ncbi:ABC transporter permease [Brachybacterium alimentarium]|uniref:Diguanylate cyclase n=3 Tax=Brachybacterium alimentarium TaxID=47845 RepID=A0A2A3YHB3_9MICO|nr:ABC transporter permease [Brachybacterium alimentarium]PCC32957.1 diguanylate cyclase [Brachybacterium alimentarium]PCC38495.1 diguanylate cyclase [Brachybacterium alimentarium]RCS81545.1 ABC transporter permease [Brachybacterium alimentarium]RCS86437.1 ABC transporter permease [Brachybacterium alimentarium]RCS87030.1 ABC transporter permease [Brachybacterium alimentarium]